jgi:hypothetical protein
MACADQSKRRRLRPCAGKLHLLNNMACPTCPACPEHLGDPVAAVLAASPELILRNLTDQIYELGHICRRKMDGLSGTTIPISIAFCAWVLNGALGLWIVRWK